MSGERLLLCRPLGGLNDILCQIEHACAYADRFERTVVVDTLEQSDRYFRDRFSNYFDSLQGNLVLDADTVRDRLDALDVSPAFLAGRVRACRPRYDAAQQSWIDEPSGRPVSFDFEHDHAATLLVHHAAGGGINSIRALARLRLREQLVDTLRARLAVVGRRYVGLHIRDTDYRTNYKALLGKAPIEAGERVFLATDSATALAHCHAAFGVGRVFSFAALPKDGSRLHHIADRADAYARNRDAIVDLLMLALARGFHMFQIEPNPFGAQFSGYSVLAANLRSNPALLARLVGEAHLDALWPDASIEKGA
jgi:hypothetical protein